MNLGQTAERLTARHDHQQAEEDDPTSNVASGNGVPVRPCLTGSSGVATPSMVAVLGVTPGIAEHGTVHGERLSFRQRLRRPRDLRAVEAFGVTRSHVDALDAESLRQLAAWLRRPGFWLVMTFAYAYSAVIVGGTFAAVTHAGWWRETDWLLVAVGTFATWIVLAQPLLVGFAAWENRVDIYLDPFLPFGRSGAESVRVLTTMRRSQLRRRTLALSCLREWHVQGTRLGLDVDGQFQRAATSLGSPSSIAEIAGELRAEIVPFLVTTAQGTFNPDKFPAREHAKASGPALIRATRWILGAPVVVAAIQFLAEHLP